MGAMSYFSNESVTILDALVRRFEGKPGGGDAEIRQTVDRIVLMVLQLAETPSEHLDELAIKLARLVAWRLEAGGVDEVELSLLNGIAADLHRLGASEAGRGGESRTGPDRI
ncbi:MAG: hypothetical protein RLZZ501_2300 [Pseudomonadota bacterium]